MTHIEQRENQEYEEDNICFRPQEIVYQAQENSRHRQAKLHVSRLIDSASNKNHAFTPAMRELLEASFTLQTISTKVLATHLRRSPATIRTEFQRILTILGDVR